VHHAIARSSDERNRETIGTARPFRAASTPGSLTPRMTRGKGSRGKCLRRAGKGHFTANDDRHAATHDAKGAGRRPRRAW
jgi:hypothetical protein